LESQRMRSYSRRTDRTENDMRASSAAVTHFMPRADRAIGDYDQAIDLDSVRVSGRLSVAG